MTRLVLFLSLMVTILPAGAFALPQDAFHGRWSGTSGENAQVSLRLDAEGDGFAVSLDHPFLDLEKVSFVPSDRNGVFEEDKGGGLFSMFMGSDTQTLHGAPILWARFAGPSLVFYRLEIAKSGHMTLDRFRLDPDGGSTRMLAERIENGMTVSRDELVLERAP
ncbi:MAG: hypothetical protein R3C97_04040 [Geminicoccaceae bacterium]